MHLKFKHITLENFLSFGYAELDLDNRGSVAIDGINNNPTDNASSNGSGKSSLIDAIAYALTGETVRGITKNLVNIHTTGGMKVDLDFEVDGVSYKIIRSKDHKDFGTAIRFYVNGKEESGKGIRDTEKIISGYLPELTDSLINSVVILGQGMPQKFTDNTPAGRKEVLEKLSKSDFMIEDIKDRLTNRKIKLSKDLKDLDIESASIQSKIDVYERQVKQYQTQLESLAEPDRAEIDRLSQKLSDNQQKLSSYKEQLQTERDELDRINSKITEQNSLQADEVESVQGTYQAQLKSQESEIYKLDAEIRTLQSEIRRLKSVVDVCPTCGQKLPDVHKVDTTDKENQLKELQSVLTSTKELYNKLKQECDVAVSVVREKYKTARLVLAEQLNSQKSRITEVSRAVESYSNDINHLTIEINKLQNSLSTYHQRVKELQDGIENSNTEISSLRDKSVYISLDREKIDNRLSVVNKMMTIATRDFRGYLLTNVIEYIDKKAKSYSSIIFNTEKISFALDGNSLNITYDDKLYENLSGGERKKCDIIVQFALRDMLCQFSNFSSNVLVLDEIFENLDELGCQKIIDAIFTKLTDIESIFIITHRSNLSLPIDTTITVVKDENGISRLA